MDPIIIIGSGLAGYMLAKEFRKLDAESPLFIITASNGRFYSKPLLSTALTAKKNINMLITAEAHEMAKQLSAKIITRTEVSKIEVSEKFVVIEGKKIKFSKLVLATGSEVIKPPILGNASHHICSVNDLEEYAQFRELISGKKKIAVMGAGLVGCEFANDLANSDYEVHIIDPALYPLQRLIPKEIGQLLQVSFQEKNIHWHLGELVKEMNYDDHHYHVLLSNGHQLQVDAVLSAVGLRPNIRLAKEAKLNTNFGILVDRYLQTSSKDIYALGDCAEVHGLVLFFILPLMQCARSLAKTLAGNMTEVIYPAMPISIKTSLCPIVVLPPPKNSIGTWQITGEGKDLKALFYNEKNHLLGFALTGKKVIDRMKLINELDIQS